MPHFIVEYSANLEACVDIQNLIQAVHDAAIETGVFPLKGTRTRAARRQTYAIADGHPDNGFVHVTARIGPGRSIAVRQQAGEAIYDAVCEYMRAYFEKNPLAISFEMQEIDPHTSFKFNNLPDWIAERKT
ncbi:MAG: 5-carboxymethyl-2-hydroxymuconate isomerase [Gammaproteobacteria bacterium]|jgi:5-carboxymethyl-2-hydroxymuconate isomerase